MWFNLPLQIKRYVTSQLTVAPTVVEFGVFTSYGHPPLIFEALQTGEHYIGVTHNFEQFEKFTKEYKDNHNISITYLSNPRIFGTNILSESADLVVFSNSFHKFINEQSLLSEVHRILKPNGTIAIARFSAITETVHHFSNHKEVSKYEHSILPFEESLGVSVELYKKV